MISIPIPKTNGGNFWHVMNLLREHVRKQGLVIRAGAISFNFLIAVPACFLFLLTLIPYLDGAHHRLYNEMQQMILSFTPDVGARNLMLKFLDNIFVKTKQGMLSLGFILAMFYSSNAMMGIIRTFDRSVKNRAKTNFIKKRLRAICLTLIMLLLFLGTLVISLGRGMPFHRVMRYYQMHNPTIGWLIKYLRWGVIIALFFFGVSLIYKYAPTVKNRKPLISLGSAIATVLLILSTFLFSLWAQNFSNYNKFYGTIGSVLVMMMMVFINSVTLLIGYELDLSIVEAKEELLKNGK